MLGLNVEALTALTFMGFAISAGASVWGIVQAKRRGKEARFGRQVSVALALMSFLIATVSLGFEKLKEQESARLQQQRDAQREQREAQWQLRADAAAAEGRRERRAMLERQELDASRRRLEATQQALLTLGLAAEERERDREGAAREQRNATRLMLALWREANRVTGDSIVVSLATRCLTRTKTEVPRVITEGSRSTLLIHGAGKRGRPASVSLASRDQRFSQETSQGRGSVSYRQINTFSGFLSDLGPFGTLQDWAGATVSLSVQIEGSEIAQRLSELIPVERQRIGEIVTHRSSGAVEIPCAADFVLAVNDKTLAKGKGKIYQIIEPDSGLQGRMFADFESFTVSREAIPKLNPSSI